MNCLKQLASVFNEVPNLIKDCGSAYLQVSKIVAKIVALFANPINLVVDAAKNIFWHGIAITGDVWHAVIDFENKDYKSAGKDIGDIVYQLILSRVEVELVQ
jgi:hypothetical protein